MGAGVGFNFHTLDTLENHRPLGHRQSVPKLWQNVTILRPDVENVIDRTRGKKHE